MYIVTIYSVDLSRLVGLAVGKLVMVICALQRSYQIHSTLLFYFPLRLAEESLLENTYYHLVSLI